jgi:hypothetical protein
MLASICGIACRHKRWRQCVTDFRQDGTLDQLSFMVFHFDPDECLMQFQSRFAIQVTPIKKSIKILVSNPLK